MTSLPLAFGFANAAILGWLAAAAAPILIHLWMKRVRRETEWAAVRFLRKALERHSRKLRLREWLLLAVRTAIILCVVLAAAKPVLEGLGLAGPGVRTHYLLVVDASLSMRYRPDVDGPSLFEEAKRLAGELIDSGRSGDVYSLMVMTQPPRVIVAQPVADAKRVRLAIDAIEPTDGAVDLEAAFAMAEQLLDRSKEQTRHVDRHEVVVLSDMARHTWAELETGGEAAGQGGAVATRLESLTSKARLSVVDLGTDGAANAAIAGIELLDPLPTAGRPLRLSATARLHAPLDGGEPVRTKAELLVNGASVAEKRVRLTPGAAATVDFTHRFERPGPSVVEVRLSEDRLAADNSGWLGVTLPERTRVLCVAGAPGAARNVVSALRPFDGEEENQPIEPVVISDAELASAELSRFAAVFFCNVAQLSEREARRVAAYVRGGGGVAFFLGDRVVPEAYNTLLTHTRPAPGRVGRWIDGATLPLTFVADEPDTRQGFLPATVGRPATSTSRTIDPLGYTHPIVQPFEGRERAGLLTTPVARYWQLLIDEGTDNAEVAFATTSGDPLLVTASVGRGRVAVVATAASLGSIDPTTGEPWTVMPAWPSFLPIVRGMLHDLAGGERRGEAPVVGDLIGGSAPASARELKVLRPDGEGKEKSITVKVGADRNWSYADTDRAGVYQISRLEAPAASDVWAAVGVNVAAAESDLSRVAPGKLPDSITVRRVAASRATGEALPTATGFHRLLLLAALTLVLIETGLAYWFGRPPA